MPSADSAPKPSGPQRRHPEGTYKTRMCDNWLKLGDCPYGRKCQFAHGAGELRAKVRPRAQESPTQATPITSKAVLADDIDFAIRCHIAEPAEAGLPASKLGEPPLAKRDVSFATKTVCGVACLALEEDSMSVLEALLSASVDSYESDQPPPPPSVDWHGLQQVWLQSSVGHQRSCPRDTNTRIAAGAA